MPLSARSKPLPLSVLRTVAAPLAPGEAASAEVKDAVKRLSHLIFFKEGVGVAAPQIGVSKRLFVVRDELLEGKCPWSARPNAELLAVNGVAVAGAAERVARDNAAPLPKAKLTASEFEEALKTELRRIGRGTKPPLVVGNPVTVRASAETMEIPEGCFSVPGWFGPVERPAEAEVEFLCLNTDPPELRRLWLRGLAARTFLHESDHLDGRLFIDRIDPRRASMGYAPGDETQAEYFARLEEMKAARRRGEQYIPSSGIRVEFPVDETRPGVLP